MKSTRVRLPTQLAVRLERRGEIMGCSKSHLVRHALEQRRQKNGRANNCKERLAELGGFFAGARDLSTNPKRLGGFGK
ncbi:MAG: hypothetical protein ABSA47_07925 [Verrucomicrobiota bacterium]